MTNLSEKASKDVRELGHELDPTRWSASQRGQSNHCLKCGRFVGVWYDSEEIYGTALSASCEDLTIVREPDAVRAHKLTEELDTALISRHRRLIDKFLEIAERKVAVIDDYGDENWEALDDEIERCVLKIAGLEGDKALDLKNDERKYATLRLKIEKKFRAYHDKCKANPLTETFDELSGVDFEVYLARLLKKLGFDVTGTPPTGDQGADLIATKNGRRIAIQAKRYQGVVGNGAVQEIVAALKFYRADEGWVITSGMFSQSDCALAQVNGIRLVDGVSLRKLQQGEPF